jgi:regulator of extracellular matrix RemA (YlzA/DUF370 family)
MMISVGDKHFIESEFIVEILKATDIRRGRIIRASAATGMLIDASGGRRVKSIIKLKSRHMVLSALGVETLKARLGNINLSSVSGQNDLFRPNPKKNHSRESKPSEFEDRRMQPDRRHFSYTHHIPERRCGTERRNKNGKIQREQKPR